MRPERSTVLGWAVVALALVLRLPRVALRWDEVALAYAAYAEPAVLGVESGSPSAIAAAWVGLHPPLHAILLGLSELWLPVPVLWLLGSVAASTLAVWALVRAVGPVAGLALATAPVQLAYAAEVNNYPLAVCGVALLLLAARARWGWLVAAAALACHSHLLGAAAAGGVVSWRLFHPRGEGERWRLALGAGLVALPVVVGALRLAGQDTTFIQPEAGAGTWLTAAAAATGPVGIVLGAVGLVGLRGPALAALVPSALLLGASLASSAAAPHQLPYLAILGVPLSAGLPAGLRRVGRAGRVMSFLAVGGMLAMAGLEGRDSARGVSGLVAAQSERRGVDLVLEAAVPGDVVWLVAPALQADDDKSDTSPILWRIPPWTWMPRARRVPFEYRDWRYGQPRSVDGRALHTSTELHEGAFDHVALQALGTGGSVWVVLYDHAPATGLDGRVERTLRPYSSTVTRLPTRSGLGDDLVWHITGRAP